MTLSEQLRRARAEIENLTKQVQELTHELRDAQSRDPINAWLTEPAANESPSAQLTPVECWDEVPWPPAPYGYVWDKSLPCCLERRVGGGWMQVSPRDGALFDGCEVAPAWPHEVIKALLQRARDVRLPGWATWTPT